ncbi:mobile element protein [Gracilibacillus boraciitolerans JCM 21714]|uniref:Mutator family transposase n=1 Tax=Gracilibacillus boraciitolerans JCM 21714 TaxID=1298598 RepID=W4VQ63_9BACI|nr:mobile element protein [Gracilibacillus boraciitolerans JCM 21714]
MFDAPTLKIARDLKDQFLSKYAGEAKYDKALEILENGFDDAVKFYAEPEAAHRHIKSTNVIERLNEEIRRRERPIRIFPNNQSAFRLIGAVLIEAQKEYEKSNRRYIHFDN